MLAIDLSGQTAIITGASRGLGAATAAQLHAAGACVVVNYLPSGDGQQQHAAEGLAHRLGDRALAVGADVRSEEDCQRLVEITSTHFGSWKILVNNAGIVRDKTAKQMTLASWQEVIDTNLTATFQMCQHATRTLADGGRIVNLASISAVLGLFGQANYAASKAGVIGLTKVLSRELARRQITVNAVAPGVVMTEMSETIPPEIRQQMLSQIPLARFGEPDDIARTILFLCSDWAAYITGQTIHVNGGWWG